MGTHYTCKHELRYAHQWWCRPSQVQVPPAQPLRRQGAQQMARVEAHAACQLPGRSVRAIPCSFICCGISDNSCSCTSHSRSYSLFSSFSCLTRSSRSATCTSRWRAAASCEPASHATRAAAAAGCCSSLCRCSSCPTAVLMPVRMRACCACTARKHSSVQQIRRHACMARSRVGVICSHLPEAPGHLLQCQPFEIDAEGYRESRGASQASAVALPCNCCNLLDPRLERIRYGIGVTCVALLKTRGRCHHRVRVCAVQPYHALWLNITHANGAVHKAEPEGATLAHAVAAQQ